jgi:hypothetical protein
MRRATSSARPRARRPLLAHNARDRYIDLVILASVILMTVVHPVTAERVQAL